MFVFYSKISDVLAEFPAGISVEFFLSFRIFLENFFNFLIFFENPSWSFRGISVVFFLNYVFFAEFLWNIFKFPYFPQKFQELPQNFHRLSVETPLKLPLEFSSKKVNLEKFHGNENKHSARILVGNYAETPTGIFRECFHRIYSHENLWTIWAYIVEAVTKYADIR